MASRLCSTVLFSALAADPARHAAKKPHLVFILQDDLGWYDVAFNGNTNNSDVSGNLTSLAADGIVLRRHYVHWHCSPTRRSFFSGRLPVHHHEQLGNPTTDDLDLRYTWVSSKLASAGYKNYFLGKADTGYLSMNHLPTRNGFDYFYGMLPGASNYKMNNRWENEHPVTMDKHFERKPAYCKDQGIKDCVGDYSTTAYGELALEIIAKHPVDEPLFLYLAWQAVHVPYDAVPGWIGDVYRGMLWKSDIYVGEIVQLLKQRGMYDNTLIVFASDNGGVANGNSHPLRGGKATNWEGGLRSASFVAGGLVPARLRGSTNSVNFHIVDWYATFSFLAGVSHHDNPPVVPQPVKPDDPSFNIYGSDSYPGVDGVNIWPMLMHPDKYEADSAHQYLVLSKEVVLAGRYKLLVAQNSGKWTHEKVDPWQNTAGEWTGDNGRNFSCAVTDLPGGLGSFPGIPDQMPCLFDLDADDSERHDLTWEPGNSTTADIVNNLWSVLNATVLTSFCKLPFPYDDHIVGSGCLSSPKRLLGDCNQECAFSYWKTKYKDGGKFPGPICGVPGCSSIAQVV